MAEKRLGRGLEALLGPRADEPATAVAAAPAAVSAERQLPLAAIMPNPFQPRLGFEERELSELIESVRAVGILQPLLVRRIGDAYQLIAGERRMRAAKAHRADPCARWRRQVSDDDMLTLALVENLQREDLNPIEKAKGFKRMIDQFSLTQEEASKRLGKDRSTIANFMRLLDLPETVQHVVSRGTISMGHARALLGLQHASAQQALALRVEEEGLSVREVERTVADMRSGTITQREKSKPVRKTAHLRDIEDRLARAPRHKGRGAFQRWRRGAF